MKYYKKILFLFVVLFFNNINISFSQLVSDFKVNDDSTSYNKFVGKVGIDSSGNFVIVWQDERYVRPTIFAQRFNYLNQPLGVNFKVNSNSDTGQTPCINVKGNGDFIVSWTDRSNSKIVTRMFDREGIPKSIIVLVSDSNYGNTVPKIGSSANGNFIIAWENYSLTNGERALFQRFNSLGNKIGNNQNVSDSGVNSRKSYTDIAVSKDGNFIVCWQDNRIEVGTYDIFMQMYDSSGNKIGNNVRVNEITTHSQQYPKVTSDSSGNFTIAWTDFRLYPNILSACQFYNKSGQLIGNNFFIAQNTSVPVFTSRDNGDIGAGIYSGSSPSLQRIRSNRTLWGSSFVISNQSLSSTKYITDIKIYKDKVVNLWQDTRNGNIDIYCNVRSYNNPDSTVGINQISTEIPDEFKLYQNYPNPFNPNTKIPFQINKVSYIELKIFDNLGRKVKTLISKKLQPGIYETEFNSDNLSSGVYYYEMKSENFIESKRMLILK